MDDVPNSSRSSDTLEAEAAVSAAYIEKAALDLRIAPGYSRSAHSAIDQWWTGQQNVFVDDNRDRSSCSKCGSTVRNTAERDGLIFYICDTCGLRGAYSIPPRGARAGSIRRSATSSES